MTRLVPAPDGLAAAGSGADDLAGALARLQQARGRGEQLVHVTVETHRCAGQHRHLRAA